MEKKWVYLFDELDQVDAYVGRSCDAARGLLGGKGANLVEMVRIGVPVPPGFTITKEACNEYLAHGGVFPEGMWDQVLSGLEKVESLTGKRFGDSNNPLLFSCRSVAEFSMPGMMDTVLNIGLNEETFLGLISQTGNPRSAYDSYLCLIQTFSSLVMCMPDQTFEDAYSRARCRAGVKTNSELSADEKLELVKHLKKIFQRHCNREFPADPYEQLHMAIAAIFDWRKSYYTANHNSSIVSEIQDLPSALVMIEAIVSGNNKEFSLSGSDKRSIASSVANKGELNLSRGKGSENKIITRKIATSREKYLKRLTLQAWPPRVDLEWGNKELEELHIRE